MSTIDKIRDVACVPTSDCEFEVGSRNVSWAIPTISLIHLTPREATAWLNNPGTLLYQRNKGNHYRRDEESLVIIIHNDTHSVIGCATITKASEERGFTFRDTQVCVPAVVPERFMVESHDEPIVVKYPRLYKTLKGPSEELVEDFRAWVLSVLEIPLTSASVSVSVSSSASASILPPSRSSTSSSESTYDEMAELEKWATYIKEFPRPLWVYMNTEDDERRIDMSICEDGHIVFHNSDCSYPNIITCLEHLVSPPPTADMAMRVLTVGQGTFKDNSLWHIWRKHPGHLDSIGVVYDKLQEKCRDSLNQLSEGCKFIVDSYSKEPIYLEEDKLFRFRDMSHLTSSDIIRVTLGRSITIQKAFEMFQLDNEDMLGHGFTLAEILIQYEPEHLQYVGVCTKYDFAMKMTKKYLADALLASNEDAKTHIVVSMFNFLIKFGESLLKDEKFRDTVIHKCFEFIQKQSKTSPIMVASAKRLLVICGESKVDIITNEEQEDACKELEDVTDKLCNRIPFLTDIHREIVAKWRSSLSEMPRGTGPDEELFSHRVRWLRKYNNVLKHSIAHDWTKNSKHYSVIHYTKTHKDVSMLTENCDRVQPILNFGPTFKALTKIDDIIGAIKKWIVDSRLEANERVIDNPTKTWVTYQYLLNYTDMLRMLME